MLPLPCGPPRAQGSWTLGLFTMFVCIVKPQSWIETTATTVLYTSCVEDFVAGFCRNPHGGVFDQTSLLISAPSCVAVCAPPHRTGQAFSPCGRVARTHGDRLVAFDSGDGTTRLPCGRVIARVRGARRAHVCTPWR